jgi:hypothetical protein
VGNSGPGLDEAFSVSGSKMRGQSGFLCIISIPNDFVIGSRNSGAIGKEGWSVSGSELSQEFSNVSQFPHHMNSWCFGM